MIVFRKIAAFLARPFVRSHRRRAYKRILGSVEQGASGPIFFHGGPLDGATRDVDWWSDSLRIELDDGEWVYRLKHGVTQTWYSYVGPALEGRDVLAI